MLVLAFAHGRMSVRKHTKQKATLNTNTLYISELVLRDLTYINLLGKTKPASD